MFCFQILAMSAMIQPGTALSDRYRSTTCRSVLIFPGLVTSAVILAVQPFQTSVWAFAGLGALRAIGDALCFMPNEAESSSFGNEKYEPRYWDSDWHHSSLGALAQITTVPTAMMVTAGMQAVASVFFTTELKVLGKKKQHNILKILQISLLNATAIEMKVQDCL